MIALLLSVIASTIIFVVFKLFNKYDVNTLHAIVVNYFVACTFGLSYYYFFSENTVSTVLTAIPTLDWFVYALALGSFFIVVFYLMAKTAQQSGLTVVSVATKMSFIIPIFFGLWHYRESLGVFKLSGILLALAAVYLTSTKSRQGVPRKKGALLLPALVFLGSGIIDTSIKYLEDTYVAQNEVSLFSAILFGAAGCIGILILFVQGLRGDFTFQLKNIYGGIALGIPNFCSIYFLVEALKSGILDSSGIFTVNNVAIVMLSTLLGIWLFKERLLPKNWIGILLAVMSILLVAFQLFYDGRN